MNATHGLAALPARAADSGLVHVVIDTPRGSRNKFKYDEELSLFRLSKVLPLGSCFPFDFGFIPSTRAGDGDAVDVLVLMDEPTFPGCLLTVRLLGVLRAEQTEQGETFSNDRLVGVPETRVNRPEIRTLDELGKGRLDEIEHFFKSYNQAEGRQFKPLGRHGPDEADRLVAEGERRYAEGAGADGNGR